MSDFPPGTEPDDDPPIDDAVDFDVTGRQQAIRMRRQVEVVWDEITASLQSCRDGFQWVDERTRKPL